MRIKRTAADHWFSRCVRLRSDFYCQGCGAKYEENSKGLHCSHYFSRAKKGIRYDALNAFSHCYGCHQKFGSNPDYFYRHYIDTYGEGALELIREKVEDIMLGKRMIKEQKQVAKHYKAEAARLENDRAAGIAGWLEFESWD
tara:strand:+ start:5267 stop:5692 length:426 start_codon:yes stop_codon:yes gene_type:complete